MLWFVAVIPSDLFRLIQFIYPSSSGLPHWHWWNDCPRTKEVKHVDETVWYKTTTKQNINHVLDSWMCYIFTSQSDDCSMPYSWSKKETIPAPWLYWGTHWSDANTPHGPLISHWRAPHENSSYYYLTKELSYHHITIWLEKSLIYQQKIVWRKVNDACTDHTMQPSFQQGRLVAIAGATIPVPSHPCQVTAYYLNILSYGHLKVLTKSF